jgi:hypothetical protein
MLVGALIGSSAQAAAKVTSFSVSVTVVAILHGGGRRPGVRAGLPAGAGSAAAAGQTGAQATIVAREPVVTVSQDPKTGARNPHRGVLTRGAGASEERVTTIVSE